VLSVLVVIDCLFLFFYADPTGWLGSGPLALGMSRAESRVIPYLETTSTAQMGVPGGYVGGADRIAPGAHGPSICSCRPDAQGGQDRPDT